MSRIIALLSLVFLALVAVALRYGDRSGLAPLAFLALIGPAYLVSRYGGGLVVGCVVLLVLGFVAHYTARPADSV